MRAALRAQTVVRGARATEAAQHVQHAREGAGAFETDGRGDEGGSGAAPRPAAADKKKARRRRSVADVPEPPRTGDTVAIRGGYAREGARRVRRGGNLWARSGARGTVMGCRPGRRGAIFHRAVRSPRAVRARAAGWPRAAAASADGRGERASEACRAGTDVRAGSFSRSRAPWTHLYSRILQELLRRRPRGPSSVQHLRRRGGEASASRASMGAFSVGGQDNFQAGPWKRGLGQVSVPTASHASTGAKTQSERTLSPCGHVRRPPCRLPACSSRRSRASMNAWFRRARDNPSFPPR